MQLTLEHRDLLLAMKTIKAAINPRALSPILESALLEADESGLTLTGTNGSMGIRTSRQAQVSEEGTAAPPARALLGLLESLPSEPVSLTYSADTLRLEVKCGEHSATLACHDPEDFPKPPEPSDVDVVELDASLLRETIERVEFAAAGDEFRPALASVYFRWGKGKLECAASDGFRLAVARADTDSGADRWLLLPAESVREYSRLLGGCDTARIECGVQGRPAHLTAGDTTLFTRTTDGNYISYDSVIPKVSESSGTGVVVDRAELVQAIRVAASISSGEHRTVRLSAREGGLTVEARSHELGNTSSQIAASLSGDESYTVLNPSFLLQQLTAFSEPIVRLWWAETGTPVRLDEKGESERSVGVIMPMAKESSYSRSSPAA